jgi:hypothetical protein
MHISDHDDIKISRSDAAKEVTHRATYEIGGTSPRILRLSKDERVKTLRASTDCGQNLA